MWRPTEQTKQDLAMFLFCLFVRLDHLRLRFFFERNSLCIIRAMLSLGSKLRSYMGSHVSNRWRSYLTIYDDRNVL